MTAASNGGPVAGRPLRSPAFRWFFVGRSVSMAGSLLSALSEGWTYFRTQTWIWSVTLAFAVFNATNMGFWQILGPVITNDTVGPKSWGLALSARGAGALLAGLILG